jgi:flagellin-like protein
MVMKKKGVSPIIATVLLLVLTLVAVSILSVFIIPFVKNSLDGSKECVNVIGKIRFDDGSAYNCHTDTRTAFSVRIDSNDIVGFKLSLYTQGVANPYTIENASIHSVLRMLSSTAFNTPLEVPLEGGLRTYVANAAYQRIEVNPILKNGKICDAREQIEVQSCTDQTIIARISTP